MRVPPSPVPTELQTDARMVTLFDESPDAALLAVTLVALATGLAVLAKHSEQF
jgi:hypothetical protein